MITVRLSQRNDAAGSGHFGARRGNRVHNGIDLACAPGSLIESPVAGQITKVGYPYGDDMSWRYVEVTDKFNYRHRLFYVEPDGCLEIGEHIEEGHAIGASQDITTRYPRQGMTPHIHYEIKAEDGTYMDPEEFRA